MAAGASSTMMAGLEEEMEWHLTLGCLQVDGTLEELSSLTVVAFVNVAAILVGSGLVDGHINVRESALTTTTRGNDAALHPEEVKATAPVARAAEGLTLLDGLVKEHLAIVPDDPASGDLVVCHALRAILNELPFHPETWVAGGPCKAVVPTIRDEAHVQVTASASIRVVHNPIYSGQNRARAESQF